MSKSQVERYKDIFARILGFQALIDDKRKINASNGQADTREDTFGESIALMESVLSDFPCFRTLSVAFNCEREEEHLHRAFTTVLGHSIRYESPLFDRLLSLTHDELVVNRETLFDRYAMNRIGKSAYASTEFITIKKDNPPKEPKLFNEVGDFLHNPEHFMHFFNSNVEHELENAFRYESEQFIKMMDKLMPIGGTDVEVHKSAFQQRGIAQHLWPQDIRHVYLFKDTDKHELMSERLRTVIKDINSGQGGFLLSKNHPLQKVGYKENLINSFMAQVDCSPELKGSLIEMLVYHINFANQGDLDFSLGDDVLPGAYFIQQLGQRGVDFCDCLRLYFSEWQTLPREAILQEVIIRLPSIPKRDYLKNHDVWFGALIEACDSDELRSIQLSSEKWLNLYQFKGETWMRDRVTQPQHLHSALEIDLGL
jgi:hypothetical protein